MKSSTNSLEYLQDIFFNDGISTLMGTYLENQNLLQQGFEYDSQHDNYVKFDLIENTLSSEPDVVADVVDRDKFFEYHLGGKKKELLHYLKQKEFDDKFLSILLEVYDMLDTCFKKLNHLNTKYNFVLDEYLTALIKDLKILFPVVDNHKVFRMLNKNRGDKSFFQYKDLKASFFGDLYEVAFNLDLIDEFEVPEDTFYDVFTSAKFNTDNKIVFLKKNHLVAYFLKEIEPFFNNLNSVTIEESKSFCNKQGKIFTSQDLYTSLSRNKDKNLDHIREIKNEILLLKKKYLK